MHARQTHEAVNGNASSTYNERDHKLKKQIINIAPVQAGKVFALLYFLITVPFVGVLGVTFFISSPQEGLSIGMLIAMPFIYALFGFVFTAIAALVYNQVAKWVGGIEYTSSDKEE